LSSNIFEPAFTISPTLTSMVGFIPTKSFASKATEVILGLSEITGIGLPGIGKSKPLFILITCAAPY
jgi:hypothetical protein